MDITIDLDKLYLSYLNKIMDGYRERFKITTDYILIDNLIAGITKMYAIDYIVNREQVEIIRFIVFQNIQSIDVIIQLDSVNKHNINIIIQSDNIKYTLKDLIVKMRLASERSIHIGKKSLIDNIQHINITEYEEY